MSEKPLGDALLKLETVPGPAAGAVAEEAIRRDRRWIRLLTSLAVVFYLLAPVGLGLYTHFYFTYIAPKMTAHAVGLAQMPKDEQERKEAARELARIFGIVHRYSQFVVLGSILALTLATLCTVVLIALTRRTTLRQVQASLAALSDQLSRVQPSPASPA